MPGAARLSALVLAGACVAAACTPAGQRADLALLDAGFRLLRALRPAAAAGEVVIVGIDDASIGASGKPFALMLDDLANLFDALREARAGAVAVDLQLPARGYDTLVPGASRRLAHALASLRDAAPLVLGAPATGAADDAGRLYAAVAGSEGLASLRVPLDPDGRLRRLAPRPDADGMPPLALQLMAQLKRPAAAGMLDFAAGPAFGYLPLARVLALRQRGASAALRTMFSGKIVVVGAVLPDQDRQRLPVPLAAWDNGATTPGVVFQAQAIRCLLDGRIVASNPLAASVLAVLVALPMWRRWRRPGLATLAAAALALAAGGASLIMLAGECHVSTLPAWLVLAAAAGRAWWQSWRDQYAEQRRLRGIFAGYVSPAILDTILSGELRANPAGRRQALAFLFADIRGFTAFCAATPPEQVIAFLNRYYGTITVPLHAHGGTVDKFSGDGIMVFFGAPGVPPNPARDAILAALGLLDALATLNADLVREGHAPIDVGIGIAYGDAVLGNIGSPLRHDYTATGAATTLAAHIQQLCKELPYALLVEQAAFERADLPAAQAALFEPADRVVDKHGFVRLAGYVQRGAAA